MSSCHDSSTAAQPRGAPSGTSTLRVALAGSPNVGKSTVFNLLTGLSQHTGNWSGKTVEQKTGYHQTGSWLVEVIDLPGTYSLTANSVEEQIARDYLLTERPDVVVAIVSAANLERNLYLVAELLELPTPLVIGLNMVDVAASEGITIEADVLAAALGVPVVPLIATRAENIGALVSAAVEIVGRSEGLQPRRPRFDTQMETQIGRISGLITGFEPTTHPLRWVATKLLEGDAAVHGLMESRLPDVQRAELDHILAENEHAAVAIASARYEWVGRMVRAAVFKPRAGVISQTERVDRFATHPVLGPIALLAILGVMFWAVYTVAQPFVGILQSAVAVVADAVHAALDGSVPWLSGLIADGALGGAGTVLTMLPVIAVFFVAMAFLEDVGYMSRAAFVADRYMHRLGLHGKSFLPLFLGFGCNVPAVLGARVIDSPPARLLTIFLASLVPCSSRVVVLVFVGGALFGASAPLVVWGLIAAAIGVLALTGAIASRFFNGGVRPPFIMELPLYHTPNWRSIALVTWQRVREFAIRAGTIITIASAAIWAFAVLPTGDLHSGYLADLGRTIEPFGSLMGLDWRMMVALISSFVAKENTIATLAVLTSADQSGLTRALPALLTPAAGLAFLVAQVFFVPCIATVSAIYQETRSLRFTLINVGYMLVLAFGSAILVYQVARLLRIGV